MLNPRLPPEIADHIVDLLRDEPATLKQCCLVSKSWIPRARKHLFGEIEFEHPADVDAWKEVFPDPANSPGYHTHSLFIDCVEVFTTADAEEGGWIRAFSNVVRLNVLNSEDTHLSSSKFLALVCSLPVLEDLEIGFLEPDTGSDVEVATFQPSISPPLTGTLAVSSVNADEIEGTIRQIINLPIRFRRLECEWCVKGDSSWINGLTEACSETLESLHLDMYWPCKASIDLSKATKLKDVTFHIQYISVEWVTSTLRTITSKHTDLREIAIRARATDWPSATAVGPKRRLQWLDLEQILIRLWESHSARAEIECYLARWKGLRELMNSLLPEATKMGIVKLVDISDLD